MFSGEVNSSVLAVILAGGKSSRMGRDKCKLIFDGKSLLDIAVDTAKQAGLQNVVINGDGSDVSVSDELAELGPIGGMRTIFQRHLLPKFIGVVFIPVDMPGLLPQDIIKLINAGALLKLPTYFNDNYLPCYLPNSDDIRRYLAAATSGNQLKIRALLNTFNAQGLVNLSPNLVNINTPEDWDSFKMQSITEKDQDV